MNSTTPDITITLGPDSLLAPCQALIFCDTTKSWLHFSSPVEIISTNHLEEIPFLIDEIEKRIERDSLSAVGWVSYEAAPAFDSSFSVNKDASDFPLLWFALFKRSVPVKISFPDHPPHYAWEPTINEHEYKAALLKIKELIAAGDTYQVNFTYRLQSTLQEENIVNLLSILNQQPPFFGGMISTDNWFMASGSPELFFTLNRNVITSRPMKGTAPRGYTTEDDRSIANQLYNCTKNRAENVMIVDMVRNDLARIAEKSSVTVSKLFAIERYPTLYQMTSTVQAKTTEPIKDIFGALFPPASITGAPKTRTTGIITELETTPRRVYTGTMGFLLPGRKAQFNVAIRTLLYDRHNKMLEYGVGSGIVWDSQPDQELEECKTKTKICKPALAPFSLFETILWTQKTGFTLLEHHLSRLIDSAAYFSFPIDAVKIETELKQIEKQLCPNRHSRVKIVLSNQGKIDIEQTAFTPFPANYSATVNLAENNVDSKNIFLYHKTTNRDIYNKTKLANPTADDVLLFNERNELTESTIANIVMKIEGTLYTPPIKCGLLAGTARADLLNQGIITEKILSVSLLKKEYPVYLLNSVRGMYPAAVNLNQEKL